MTFLRALGGDFRSQINTFTEVFPVFARLGRPSALPFYSFRQLHDSNGKITHPRFIVERAGTEHLIGRKQAVAFCVAGASVQRPLMFSDLNGNPGHERSAGNQLVRLPGTKSIGMVHSIPALGAVPRRTTFVQFALRCATPQLVSYCGRRTTQHSGNGPVGQALLLQSLDSTSFFSLKMLSALAFRQICDIMTAVQSDCPPSINVMW